MCNPSTQKAGRLPGQGQTGYIVKALSEKRGRRGKRRLWACIRIVAGGKWELGRAQREDWLIWGKSGGFEAVSSCLVRGSHTISTGGLIKEVVGAVELISGNKKNWVASSQAKKTGSRRLSARDQLYYQKQYSEEIYGNGENCGSSLLLKFYLPLVCVMCLLSVCVQVCKHHGSMWGEKPIFRRCFAPPSLSRWWIPFDMEHIPGLWASRQFCLFFLYRYRMQIWISESPNLAFWKCGFWGWNSFHQSCVASTFPHWNTWITQTYNSISLTSGIAVVF